MVGVGFVFAIISNINIEMLYGVMIGQLHSIIVLDLFSKHVFFYNIENIICLVND